MDLPISFDWSLILISFQIFRTKSVLILLPNIVRTVVNNSHSIITRAFHAAIIS